MAAPSFMVISWASTRRRLPGRGASPLKGETLEAMTRRPFGLRITAWYLLALGLFMAAGASVRGDLVVLGVCIGRTASRTSTAHDQRREDDESHRPRRVRHR
jgi:hypothetical protein